MCGIAGFINFENGYDLAQRANQVQQHRGPDHQSIWESDRITLAHQRLSIIDLNPRSNQPLEKDGLCIIFNGEIYNYQALKQELLSGFPALKFITSSDTEVVLELFRAYGTACLDKLIGMFVFSIYDTSTRKLILARDHFGIKPLFYTRIGNKFAFSSELKTLVHTPGFNKNINKQTLLNSINYLWVPGDETMFENCFKLAPGHYMSIQCDAQNLTIDTQKYWELQENIKHRDEASAIKATEEVMERSIARHMVADVPVSAFLSGGLDSSLISVMTSKHNSNLSTYTIGTDEAAKKVEKMPEDEVYAKQLATLHGFDHHEIVIQSDIVKALPEMVKTLDEPIGDPAALNTYLICKSAREKGVKVLLSGMGADEIFFGYRRQMATMIGEQFKKLPRFIQSSVAFGVKLLPVKIFGRGFKLGRWAKRFLSFAALSTEKAYMKSYSYYNDEELQQLFIGDHKEHIKNLNKQHESIFNEKFQGDKVNQICNTDIQMFMLGLNLTYTDRASMAASVEVRVPFIDKEVITTAMAIPGSVKYKSNTPKYILKKAAEKYLPTNIIYRPKASFGAPIRAWISNELKVMVDDLLSEENIKKRGIFDHNFVRNLIESDRKGIEDNAYRIYQLLTVELWFQEFVD